MSTDRITKEELQSGALEFFEAAKARGECFIITEGSSDGAALVPVEVLRTWELSRKKAAGMISAVAEASDISENEALETAIREVQEYRKEKN